MENLQKFSSGQIKTVNDSVEMAEELVSNFYKLSINQWLRLKYDINTLVDLDSDEIIHGPFAQIIRYGGQHKDTSLGTSSYDFYKICLQDHSILSAIKQPPKLKLFSFSVYIIIHELIHIVRFNRFLQNFNASSEEKIKEEARVHEKTYKILSVQSISGLTDVLDFYEKWLLPVDGLTQVN